MYLLFIKESVKQNLNPAFLLRKKFLTTLLHLYMCLYKYMSHHIRILKFYFAECNVPIRLCSRYSKLLNNSYMTIIFSCYIMSAASKLQIKKI